jgi:1-acyl-sn-glycerol-3-phosphate acyltransferase
VKRGAVDPGLFKTCSKLLQKNKTLILFPEGTRSKNGTLLSFKPGIGFLAATNSVPVIPCNIYGARNSFASKIVDPDINSDKLKIRDFFLSRIRVKFGDPIQPNGLGRNRNDYTQFAVKVRNEVEKLGK